SSTGRQCEKEDLGSSERYADSLRGQARPLGLGRALRARPEAVRRGAERGHRRLLRDQRLRQRPPAPGHDAAPRARGRGAPDDRAARRDREVVAGRQPRGPLPAAALAAGTAASARHGLREVLPPRGPRVPVEAVRRAALAGQAAGDPRVPRGPGQRREREAPLRAAGHLGADRPHAPAGPVPQAEPRRRPRRVRERLSLPPRRPGLRAVPRLAAGLLGGRRVREGLLQRPADSRGEPVVLRVRRLAGADRKGSVMSQSKRRALFVRQGLPDPGPTPSVEMTQLTVLLPRKVAAALDELHALVAKHYPSRNDFLQDVLRAGLQTALEAQREAVAEAARRAQAEADAEQNLVELVPTMPKELR